MNEIVGRPEGGIKTRLDELAIQAHTFAVNAAVNMLQMGRVLTEVKALLPHGQWLGWIAENAGMSDRTAQDYMRAWKLMGDNPNAAQLGASKIIALLATSDAEREALLNKYDVSDMTSRELKAAIRAEREAARAEALEEARDEIDAANEARDAAEARADELERRSAEADEDALEAAREEGRAEAKEAAQEEIDEANEGQQHFAEMARKANNEKAQLERERNKALADLDEMNDINRELNEQNKQLYEQVSSLKSAQARGEAARGDSGELTIDAFSRAVRDFMGLVARMPYMQTTFCGMAQGEKEEYAALLRTVEGWTQGARKALNSVPVAEGVTICE